MRGYATHVLKHVWRIRDHNFPGNPSVFSCALFDVCRLGVLILGNLTHPVSCEKSSLFATPPGATKQVTPDGVWFLRYRMDGNTLRLPIGFFG